MSLIENYVWMPLEVEAFANALSGGFITMRCENMEYYIYCKMEMTMELRQAPQEDENGIVRIIEKPGDVTYKYIPVKRDQLPTMKVEDIDG